MTIKGNSEATLFRAARLTKAAGPVLFAAVSLLAAVLATGCTAKFYRRSADKEAYKLIAEKAGLVTNMAPAFTIQQTNIPSLEGLSIVTETNDFLGQVAASELGARVVSLEEALLLGIRCSRLYQTTREQLYIEALSLSLARHDFAPIFSGTGDATFTEQNVTVTGMEFDPATGQWRPVTSEALTRDFRANGRVGVDWLIRDVGRLSVAFTADLSRLITGGPNTLASSQVAGTFTRPLLRNSGYKTQSENLTQAERDLLYQIREFVRFRKTFSVQVASSYYGVLRNRDSARNAYLNLLGSRRAGDRTRALAAEGRTTQSDLGRIEQQELSAESSWVDAVRAYQRALDDFKIQLGVPVESKLVLDDAELRALKILDPAMVPDDAVRLALTARLDYQNTVDRQADSDRKVALAKDSLKPQLDLVASGGFSSGEKTQGFPVPDPNRYRYSAGANIDLGLDRKAERNGYRQAIITAEAARRTVSQRRDEIELEVRESLRTLEQARRNYEISEIGVNLAERRVEEQELLAELGRAKALDQVDAQNALSSSKDQRTQALVAHTIARIQFWDNVGILYIKDNGQWEEGPLKKQAAK